MQYSYSINDFKKNLYWAALVSKIDNVYPIIKTSNDSYRKLFVSLTNEVNKSNGKRKRFLQYQLTKLQMTAAYKNCRIN